MQFKNTNSQKFLIMRFYWKEHVTVLRRHVEAWCPPACWDPSSWYSASPLPVLLEAQARKMEDGWFDWSADQKVTMMCMFGAEIWAF